ncbi:serine/threonine-protein kinase ATM-like protein, partial [Trifolium pratense]
MQTDLPDILHLRKNLLKAVLNHLDWKGYSKLTERMGLYLPSAMFALCVGFLTFTEFFKEIGLVHISFDVIESLDNSHKVEDPKHQCLQQFLDCSVEVLTEIHKVSNAE